MNLRHFIKTICLTLVFFGCFHSSYADQLDSLWSAWTNESLDEAKRVNSLKKYIWEGFLFSDPDSAYHLSQIWYEYSEQINDPSQMGWAILTQGVTLKMRGGSIKALNYYLKALKLFEEAEDFFGIAGVLNNIGLMYEELGDYEKAIEYNIKSLDMRKQIGDLKGVSASLGNLASIYKEQGKYQEALDFYEQSLEIKIDLGFEQGIAMSYNDLGLHYFELNDYNTALEYFNKSLEICGRLKKEMVHSEVNIYLGNTYLALSEIDKAIIFCENGLEIADEISNLEFQFKACNCLYEAYKKADDTRHALTFFERSEDLSDSLHKVETSQKLQAMEFDKRLYTDSVEQAEKERIVQQQHEEEVRNKNRTRNIYLIAGLFSILIAIGLYSRLRFIRKAKSIIEKEKDRSENLLLNILPAEIAEELKEKGRADARDFEMVSILFTDFKGFTETSAKLSASELVEEINYCFKAFDEIIEDYNVEKIKTIGDAYMAAGGLPVPTNNSVKNTVLAALKMQEFITNRKRQKDEAGKPGFEMRVGIHTGPVVAGIVGVKKFQYDVWGDTVNTASRMESRGKTDRVNISQDTYEYLKNDPDLTFESRGKISVKGKGEIEMWFAALKHS